MLKMIKVDISIIVLMLYSDIIKMINYIINEDNLLA